MSTEVGAHTAEDLEQERDFLLSSLADLEAERAAGDIDDVDYQALRDDYTARAAATLKVLEGADLGSSTTAELTPLAGEGGRPSRRRAVVVATLVVAFALGAGALMARSSGERLPGKPASGSIAATGPSDDLARARALILQGKTLDAIRIYDTILAAEPDEPEALTYRGWLVLLAGRQATNPDLVGKGLAAIERAIAVDPTYPDPHFFRGLALFDNGAGDANAAVAELRRFLAGSPPAQYVTAAEDTLRAALTALAGGPVPPAAAPAG